MRRTSRSSSSERKGMAHFQCQIKNTLSEYYFIVSNEMQCNLLWYLSLYWYSLFSFPSSITSLSHRLSWEKRGSFVIIKVSKSISENSFVSKEIDCFFLNPLRPFRDNYEDVQTDLSVRILHYLVLVFEKNIIRWTERDHSLRVIQICSKETVR